MPETLQVSTNSYRRLVGQKSGDTHPEWVGKRISKEIEKVVGLTTFGSVALQKFVMDKSRGLTGYLVGMAEKPQVILIVFDPAQQKFIFETVVSKYELLVGAYKATENSWITDIDGNGTLDIAVRTDLVDFEFPNEIQDNISHGEQFLYLLTEGQFNYAPWESDVLPGLQLRK